MNLASAARDLLDLFLPRGCVTCGERIPPEEPSPLVCARCRSLFREPPPPRCPRCHLPLGTGQPRGEACLECAQWPGILASARSAVVMEPPADALVHALKYGGWRVLGDLMGARMAPLATKGSSEAVVVPVPTTARRRRMRGYNQAEVLAETVARSRRLPLVNALSRPEGRTQVHLGPAERRRNVAGTFQLSPGMRSRIRGREVILIDDVLTTGATALSAAGALGEAEVEVVHLLTFARALPFGGDTGRPPRSDSSSF